MKRRKAIPTSCDAHQSSTPGPQWRRLCRMGFKFPNALSYSPGPSWLVQEARTYFFLLLCEWERMNSGGVGGKLEKTSWPKRRATGQGSGRDRKSYTSSATAKNELVAQPRRRSDGDNSEVPHTIRRCCGRPGREGLRSAACPDEREHDAQLVPRVLVRAWMREEGGRLYARQPARRAVAADGGRHGRPAGALPEQDCSQLTGEFF